MNILKILAISWFTLLISACSQPQPISIAYHTWLGYVIPFVDGADKEYPNIKYFHTNSASATMQMLLDGSVHGGYLTLDEVMQLQDKGIKLKVVLVADTSVGADVVLAQPEITNREQIIGKKIAYESSALGRLMLFYFLNKYNLREDQVKLVSMNLNSQENAFKNKQIDIAISYFPEAWQLMNMNSRQLFSSREIPNTIVDVLAIRSDILESQPKSACNAVFAHLNGLEKVRSNINNSKYILASLLDISDQQVMDNMAKMSLPSAEINYSLLKPQGELEPVAMRLNNILNDAKITNQKMAKESLFSDHCVLDYLESK